MRRAEPATVLAPAKRCKQSSDAIDLVLNLTRPLTAIPVKCTTTAPRKAKAEQASCSADADTAKADRYAAALAKVQPRERSLRIRVEEAISREMELWDPRRSLQGADFYQVQGEITETVMRVMNQQRRDQLGDEERGYIWRKVRERVQPGPGATEEMILDEIERKDDPGAKPMRCQQHDHVVCCRNDIDGQRKWASGIVHLNAINEDNAEAHGQTPYIHVMIDELSSSRLVAVPERDCHLQRAATCNADELSCDMSPPPALMHPPLVCRHHP